MKPASLFEQVLEEFSECAHLNFACPLRRRNKNDLPRVPEYIRRGFIDPDLELRRQISISDSMTKSQARLWARLSRFSRTVGQ